jgi:hypothetical protein
VALPEAYAPASIAPEVTGACKPPLHDKVVVGTDPVSEILCISNAATQQTMLNIIFI